MFWTIIAFWPIIIAVFSTSCGPHIAVGTGKVFGLTCASLLIAGSGHSCNGDSCAQPVLAAEILQEEDGTVNALLASLPAGVLIIHERDIDKKCIIQDSANSVIHDVMWADRRFVLKEGLVRWPPLSLPEMNYHKVGY